MATNNEQLNQPSLYGSPPSAPVGSRKSCLHTGGLVTLACHVNIQILVTGLSTAEWEMSSFAIQQQCCPLHCKQSDNKKYFMYFDSVCLCSLWLAPPCFQSWWNACILVRNLILHTVVAHHMIFLEVVIIVCQTSWRCVCVWCLQSLNTQHRFVILKFSHPLHFC